MKDPSLDKDHCPAITAGQLRKLLEGVADGDPVTIEPEHGGNLELTGVSGDSWGVILLARREEE